MGSVIVMASVCKCVRDAFKVHDGLQKNHEIEGAVGGNQGYRGIGGPTHRLEYTGQSGGSGGSHGDDRIPVVVYVGILIRASLLHTM